MVLFNKNAYLLLFAIIILGCKQEQRVSPSQYSVEIFSDDARSLISDTAVIKVIARGFNWSEGTLWLKEQHELIFSDVPENKIYSWSEKKGLAVWLEPSGYTASQETKREGSNGLLLNDQGQLVLCQHGDRRIAVMDSPLSSPQPKFISIADNWRGKKFNSPNDAAYYNGDLYFTDPPYGLPGQEEDPEKELGFSGVFRITPKGLVILVDDKLSKPNGIAFSPATNSMYVSNSDPKKAIWTKYELTGKTLPVGKVIFDATEKVTTLNGLPDGLKVHPTGYVFATGPGGIWVFSPNDQLVALIHIPQATANCAFDDTYSNLYVAADSTILKISLIAPPLRR